jgi:hypothetical protein
MDDLLNKVHHLCTRFRKWWRRWRDRGKILRQQVIGVDFGLVDSPTSIVVLDIETGKVVSWRYFPRMDWESQRDLVRKFYASWKPVGIWVGLDDLSAIQIEVLQEEGLPIRPFTITHRSKRELTERLIHGIECGEVIIPADFIHEDHALALELAWYGITKRFLVVDFV